MTHSLDEQEIVAESPSILTDGSILRPKTWSHRMLKKRWTALFSAECARDAGSHFLKAFGLLWLLTEAAAFFFPDIIQSFRSGILLAVVAGALLWAVYRAFPPVRFTKEYPASNCVIELRVGDLFEQKGDIAFGCSDCFDTETGVIGPTSLMAQFAEKAFDGDVEALDRRISESLSEHKIKGRIDKKKTFGKNERFPIGATASIVDNERNVFLTAFSRTNLDTTTETSKEDLWLSLCHLWTGVRQRGYLAPVSIPVWGTGLARVPASRLSLIQVVILSFVIATRENKVSNQLTLVFAEGDYSVHEMREAVQLVDALDF